MDPWLTDWLSRREFYKYSDIARERLMSGLLANAEKALFPLNVRRATPGDIKVGNIIWYKPGELPQPVPEPKWRIVERILHDDEDYPGFDYVAHDSTPQGLRGAYIEL